MAAIHVVSVRGDPCGAVCPTHCTTRVTTYTEFKILTINPGVVTAIHVAGVRGEPCGAVRWTAVQCQREVRLEIKIQLCYSLREY